MRPTGNKLDIGLKSGDSFFAVQTPNGVKLTSQSVFTLNDSGTIVTKEGYKLLPDSFMETENDSIIIPKNANLTIANDGTVSADGKEVGKIFVGKVKNTNELQKLVVTNSKLTMSVFSMEDASGYGRVEIINSKVKKIIEQKDCT